jgi:hypothetical protein
LLFRLCDRISQLGCDGAVDNGERLNSEQRDVALLGMLGEHVKILRNKYCLKMWI